MIKKVKVDQLKPGVYISDFNCNWISHPFLTSKKRINSYRDVEKIKRTGIDEVYIDTTKGIDVYDTFSKDEFLRIFESDSFQISPGDELDFEVQVPLKKELKRAREIQNQASQILKKAYQDIRYGNGIRVDEVASTVKEIVNSISRNHDALLLISNIKNKDEYTYEHSINVSILTAGICKALKMEKEEIVDYTLGAFLHDIGKSKIPNEILNKKTPLTPKEFEILKKHVNYGMELVSSHEHISENALSVIAEHHERLNGTGYPRKLNEYEISKGGKVGAIIDVYDALTSNRVYHPPLNPVQAIKEIYAQRLIHFDEDLIEQFIRFLGIYPPGSIVKLESGFLAIVIEAGRANILRPIVRLIYDLKKDIPITPRNLDLSKGIGELHNIVGTVDPIYYKINLNEYLLNLALS
ncbi:MAG: HD-GYP domain-containing protein [Calditrichaeota bacterium]|nr:HD-GYP domain-containing protein [Calditrichota bacterium]